MTVREIHSVQEIFALYDTYCATPNNYNGGEFWLAILRVHEAARAGLEDRERLDWLDTQGDVYLEKPGRVKKGEKRDIRAIIDKQRICSGLPHDSKETG